MRQFFQALLTLILYIGLFFVILGLIAYFLLR